MSVSVVIPTRGRTQKLVALIRQLDKQISFEDEIIVISDNDDTETQKAMLELHRNMDSQKIWWWSIGGDTTKLTASEKWNIGATKCHCDTIVFGADDITFQTEDWRNRLDLLVKKNNNGYVGFANGYNHWCPTHFAATVDWLRRCNGGVLSIPHYSSQCMDAETYLRSVKYGGGIWTDEIVISHDHPYVTGIAVDETYKRGWSHADEDQKMFEKRKLDGFPNDFKPIL